jgi:hypothetical protein
MRMLSWWAWEFRTAAAIALAGTLVGFFTWLVSLPPPPHACSITTHPVTACQGAPELDDAGAYSLGPHP